MLLKNIPASRGSDQINMLNLQNNYPKNSRFLGLNAHFCGQKRHCNELVLPSTRTGQLLALRLFSHSHVSHYILAS
jgi:hypothetical protein